MTHWPKKDSKRSRWLMRTMDRMFGQSNNRSLTAGFGVMKKGNAWKQFGPKPDPMNRASV